MPQAWVVCGALLWYLLQYLGGQRHAVTVKWKSMNKTMNGLVVPMMFSRNKKDKIMFS